MSTALHPVDAERRDVRTILTTGVELGLATVAGVVTFALLSRSMSGRAEVVIQSLIILAGGALASYLPAASVRPRSVDAIGWSALIGLLGAVVYTVIDTAALRPLKLYPWTWDAIGGGSGWWYLPLWFMGSAFLAWLGALVYAYRARAVAEVNVIALAVQTVGLGIVIFGALTGTGLAPFHAAIAGLAYAVSLVIHVPVVAVLNRQ